MLFQSPSILLSLLATALLPSVKSLDIPKDVFSLHDLKGADTRPITNVYAFGDSYTDNCNYARSLLIPAAAAQYPFPSCPSSPTGRADLALSWPEVAQLYRPDWNVSIYAFSGATCDSVRQDQGSPDVGKQIDLFQTRFGTVSPPTGLTSDPNSTVATLLIGINDIHLIQLKKWGQLPSYDHSNGSVFDSISCISARLDRLHTIGFRRFVLFEIPPVQYTGAFSATKAHMHDSAKLVNQTNSLLHQAAKNLTSIGWKNDGSTISIFPSTKLFTPIAQLNPAYEFKYAAGRYCNQTCRDPYDHVYADDLHYSYFPFKLLANAFVRFLDPNFGHGPIFSDVN